MPGLEIDKEWITPYDTKNNYQSFVIIFYRR